MLDQITPVILTRNEAANIARTLERLTWARDIVIVDSLSDDDTARLARSVPQVRLVSREFDTLAQQWEFALKNTGIQTEWVLALDADYVLSPALVEELSHLAPATATAGYRASFRYLVDGRPLRGSAYPPVKILFRRHLGRYVQDGHAHRLVLDGNVKQLRHPVYHDDRKPLDRWLEAQRRYMRLEADKLMTTPWRDLSWSGRMRLLKVVSPVAMAAYCLLWKGAILDGRAGLHYAMQRTLAEILLSLYLLDGRHTSGRMLSRSAEAIQRR